MRTQLLFAGTINGHVDFAGNINKDELLRTRPDYWGRLTEMEKKWNMGN